MTTVFAKPWWGYLVKEHRLRLACRLLLYFPIIVVSYIAVLFVMQTLLPPEIRRLLGINGPAMVIGVLLGTWLCRRVLDRRDMASLGFGRHRGWLLDLGLGLLLGGILMAGIFVVEVLLQWINVRGFAWDLQPRNMPLILLVTVSSTLASAVMEETVVRGYLFRNLEEHFGTLVTVIVTSIVYGMFHLINPTATGWARYVIPFTLSLLGILFAMAYLVHRSLWLPIALHFSWNIFEYDVFALTGARVQTATVLVTNVTGPTLWVGFPNSSFGPEVGLLGVLTILLGIGLLGLLRRFIMPSMAFEPILPSDYQPEPSGQGDVAFS